MYSIFREHKADIILLQEVHSDKKSISQWETEWGSQWTCSHGETNARGVAILTSRKFSKIAKISNVISDKEGRMVLCNINVENQDFLVGSIYGHNTDNPVVIENISCNISKYDAENIIIGGDFNFVLGDNDSKNRQPSHRTCREHVIQLMDNFDLVDIWRIMNPDLFGFTWYKMRPSPMFCRLDWFLINTGAQSCVKACNIFRCQGTDHDGVSLCINIDNYKRGPGTWKFNNQLLCDDNFIVKMKETIRTAKANATLLDPFEKWEFMKIEITDFCKTYSKEIAKSKKSEMSTFTRMLSELKEEIVKAPVNHLVDIENAIKHLEGELQKHTLEKVNSYIFRSRVQFARDGEQNSKYFFGLEKRNYFSKNMRSVRCSDGSITCEQSKILKEQTKFYKSLYTSNKEVCFKMTPSPGEILLKPVDRDSLDQPITTTEYEKQQVPRSRWSK